MGCKTLAGVQAEAFDIVLCQSLFIHWVACDSSVFSEDNPISCSSERKSFRIQYFLGSLLSVVFSQSDYMETLLPQKHSNNIAETAVDKDMR